MRYAVALTSVLFTFLFSVSVNSTEKTLDHIRAVIFDMDGVLRCGFDKIEGATEMIKWMDENDVPGLILTNECRYSEAQLREDLRGMGIDYPMLWEIYTSGHSVRDYFQHKVQSNGNIYVYVIGEAGLRQAMGEVSVDNFHIRSVLPAASEKDSLYVVFGSVDQIQINDLEHAIKWINAGAKVLTTCPDYSDPSSKGNKLVGMPHHMVHIIKMSAPCIPYSLGKPHPFITQAAIARLQKKEPSLKPHEILFVGDSLDTDIRAAFEGGLSSALVLTGNTRNEGANHYIVQADFIFSSIKELHHSLAESRRTQGVGH